MDRIPISPTVLVWARESAGLDLQDAAKRLHLSQETLAILESGSAEPTVAQLRKAAKLYKRPLAVLLLPSPPKDFDPIRDFRKTRPHLQPAWSPALHAEFKRVLFQREVFLELSELAPSIMTVSDSFLRIKHNTPVEEAGKQIRQLSELAPAGNRINAQQVLNHSVSKLEEQGVIVVKTRGISRDEMRGFSVAKWPFPIIALTGGEWPKPQLFTLLHELCHLGLHAGGICDLHETPTAGGLEDVVEHYCNQVAAAALMPEELLLQIESIRKATINHQWTLTELEVLSNKFAASSEAVLLRLVALRKATWDLYWARKIELEVKYEEARARERAIQKEADGGPSYYTIKARSLGHGYVMTVVEAFHARAISSLDVADYLDVKFDQIPKLVEAILQ